MIGAICGDFIGSVYEHHNLKSKEFPLFSPDCRFTDDSVLTIATMDVLINKKEFGKTYKYWYRKHPEAGYGGSFVRWASGDRTEAYNSWGNGSAMRVSPIGLFFNDLEDVLTWAKLSAEVTHNHPEGIKGAQAAAACVFLARNGRTKEGIKKYIEKYFDYNLEIDIDKIRPFYSFDVSCQGSVPQAIACFLQSKSFEDGIRNAISIGGDSDTIACITGAISEAFYGEVPKEIKETVFYNLPKEFQHIIDAFYGKIKGHKKRAKYVGKGEIR